MRVRVRRLVKLLLVAVAVFGVTTLVLGFYHENLDNGPTAYSIFTRLGPIDYDDQIVLPFHVSHSPRETALPKNSSLAKQPKLEAFSTNTEQNASNEAQYVTAKLKEIGGTLNSRLKHETERDEGQGQSLRSLYDESREAYRGTLVQMESRWEFEWIRRRMKSVWEEMEAEGRRITDDCRRVEGKAKRVMILPGVLTLTNFAKPESIRSGGPLGELMQWADLIAACLALCHRVALRVHVQSTGIELRVEMDERMAMGKNVTGCGVSDYADVIYTDIGAYRTLPVDIVNAYRHKFRILDAFGTEPAYNDPEYARWHDIAIHRWGTLGLWPKQFYTLYPHTPDNSFLGFTISSARLPNATKQNFALIIGKEPGYLQTKLAMLTAIQELVPLRATMSRVAERLLPTGAEVMGVLDPLAYEALINTAKICVGLGDPIESPSALEVLARGCVFLNPRRKGELTLRGKPTGREIRSQVPYLEHFVGPPHTYVIDTDDLDGLRATIRAILSGSQVESFIPREFTVGGYLERLHAYLLHQDFCPSKGKEVGADRGPLFWPPATALKPIVAPAMMSCKQACHDKGLVCEPDFFPLVNTADTFTRLRLDCRAVRTESELHAPAHITNTQTCVLQGRAMLFSCAGGQMAGTLRICPCRDFIKHQLALCQQCL